MNYIDDYRLSKLPKKLKYANFKRKIEADEISPEKILKRYRYEFPNTVISSKDVQWQHDKDVHVLYDKKHKKPCFIMSDTMTPILVNDTMVKKFNYKKDVWTPNNLPKLCSGALLSIFKHLPGWELSRFRLVSKEWNHLITNQKSHWKLPRLPAFVQRFWRHKNLSPFRIYIQSMFLGTTDSQVVNFFFKEPEFFRYICILLIGNTVQLKRSTSKTRIVVGRYSICKCRGVLLCDDTQVISVQLFLDAYRQSIL